MIARHAVLLACAFASAACGGSSQRRLGTTYAAPGGPIFTVIHETSSGSTSGGPVTRNSSGEHALGWESGSSYSRIDESWVIATDPVTGARTQLGWVAHVASGGLEPFFWDAARRILWVVVAPSRRIVGLVAGGVVFPDDDRARLVTGNAARDADVYADRGAHQYLPAPFGHSGRWIWNAVDGAWIEAGAAGDSKWYYDRPLLRAVKLPSATDTEVTLTTIDWSKRSTEARRWSPSVDPSEGVRRAIAITADGRHVVQVLERDDRLAMQISTIDGTASRIVVLDASYRSAAQPRSFEILPFYDDAIIVRDRGSCTVNHSARTGSGDHAPIPADLCVSDSPQRQILPVTDRLSSAVIDAKGVLKPVGNDVRFVNRIAPSTLVFARSKNSKSPTAYVADDPAIEWVRLDLKTGEDRVVTLGEAQPNVVDWRQGVDAFVPFVEITVVTKENRADSRVRVPSWTGGAPIELPTPGVIGSPHGIKLNSAGAISPD